MVKSRSNCPGFERDKSVISRHIKNIFKDQELIRNSVVAFFATTAADGKIYQVEYFNLDVIISVGYRVNSKKAIENIKQLLPTKTSIHHRGILGLISTFADTWLSLDAYDRDELTAVGASKKSVKLSGAELSSALTTLKQELIRKGEATDIFAFEKGTGNVEGSITIVALD